MKPLRIAIAAAVAAPLLLASLHALPSAALAETRGIVAVAND